MVEAPALKKQISLVPTACTQTESCVLNVSVQKAWDAFAHFKFNEISPNVVAAVEWTEGKAGELGSCAKVSYKDGSSWTVRFSELSEKHHRVCYELIQAEPSVSCTSVQGEIQLLRISQTNQTYLQWTTEFSNDADLVVIQDQKYKKQEAFEDIQKTLAGGATSAAAKEESKEAPASGDKSKGGADAAGGASGTMPAAASSVKVHAPPGGKSSGPLW